MCSIIVCAETNPSHSHSGQNTHTRAEHSVECPPSPHIQLVNRCHSQLCLEVNTHRALKYLHHTPVHATSNNPVSFHNSPEALSRLANGKPPGGSFVLLCQSLTRHMDPAVQHMWSTHRPCDGGGGGERGKKPTNACSHGHCEPSGNPPTHTSTHTPTHSATSPNGH